MITIALVGFAWASGSELTGALQKGPAAPPRHVLIMRHAEKTDDPANARLSKRGEERARALPQLFAVSTERAEPLPVPDYILVTRATASSDRPAETVTPLAAMLKLPIDRTFRNFLPGEEPADKKENRKGVFDLADEILSNPQYAGKTVLICWHHGTIPDLAGRLKATGYPKRWRDSVFDRVWQISYDAKGKATFADHPQRLLPGDSVK